MEDRQCRQCQQPFAPRQSHQWYCSPECRASRRLAQKIAAGSKYKAAHAEQLKLYHQMRNRDRRAYHAAYKAAHPDQQKIYQAKYRALHPEKIRAYNAAHRDERTAAKRAHYAAHRDELAAQAKLRRQERASSDDHSMPK